MSLFKALGAIRLLGSKAGSKAASTARRGGRRIRQADSRIVDKVNNKIMPTSPVVTSRSATIPQKVAARDAAAAATRSTARKIVNTGYTGAGIGIGGAIIGAASSGSKPSSSPKPRGISKPAPKTSVVSTSKPASKPAPKPMSNATASKSKSKPKVKMASVPTVRNSRLPTVGAKTKVPVGSSIIRNRDGSIKKIKPPSGKKPKNKFDRMTTAQVTRLRGKELKAYKAYKAKKK
jgi:hypothetical protein